MKHSFFFCGGVYENFSFAHNPVLLIAQLRRRVETPKGNEFRLGELQFTGLLVGRLPIEELLWTSRKLQVAASNNHWYKSSHLCCESFPYTACRTLLWGACVFFPSDSTCQASCQSSSKRCQITFWCYSTASEVHLVRERTASLGDFVGFKVLKTKKSFTTNMADIHIMANYFHLWIECFRS